MGNLFNYFTNITTRNENCNYEPEPGSSEHYSKYVRMSYNTVFPSLFMLRKWLI